MADENGLFTRLYIDEDVHESLLSPLRQQGFETTNVREANRRSLSDAEQLAYAVSEGYTIFTFNAADYIALHLDYTVRGQSYAGIIVAKQMPIGETLRRLLYFLNKFTRDEVRNQLFWLPPAK